MSTQVSPPTAPAPPAVDKSTKARAYHIIGIFAKEPDEAANMGIASLSIPSREFLAYLQD